MPTATHFNPQTLPALLAHRARHTPHDVAYRFPELEQAATWAQLWQQVQQLAAGLARQGLGPGDRVALLLEGRLELVVALFGIVAVGAVAVPLNAYCKLAELHQYLLDARPAALIMGTSGLHTSHSELLATPPAPAPGAAWLPQKIFVQGKAAGLSASCQPFADLLAGPLPTEAEALVLCTATLATAPAVLLYTAGSTGQPKGVLRSTASFLGKDTQLPKRSRTLAMRLRDRMTRRFMVLSLLPLYHQGGISALLSLLESRNVPVALLTHFNPLTALRVAEQVRSRLLIGTPFMLQAMLTGHPDAGRFLQSVWAVALGAAAVTHSLFDMLLAQLPSVYVVIVGYGSSEAGTVASGNCFMAQNKNPLLANWLRLLSRLNLLTGEIPHSLFHQTPFSVCGRVNKDVQVRTLDLQTGQPLPAGQPGELAVRSHCVMPYAHDEATATDGWYRTGDIGYVTPDGVLILTDRLKRVISRGGEKISPTEVENVVRRHPAVADVYVVGVPDALYGEQVCAVVTERPGVRLEVAELRAQLAEELSQFKVPKYIVCVPSLPLLGSGKLAGEQIRQNALHQVSNQAYA